MSWFNSLGSNALSIAKAHPYATGAAIGIVGLIGILRFATRTRWSKSNHLLKNKKVLITGGNTGIGFQTAMEAAKFGASEVTIVCRTKNKGEESVEEIKREAQNSGNNQLTVKLFLCDLGSLQSVRDCANALKKDGSKYDLLILNAGAMVMPEGKTVDGFETQIGINHLGHFLFTNLFLENGLLEQNARVVSVSSLAHWMWPGFDLEDLNWEKRKYNANQAYGASKAANILFTIELQKRFDMEKKGRLAFAVHPGFVRTKLVNEPSWARTALMAIYPLYWSISLSPLEGVQNTLYAATSPDLERQGGAYLDNLKVVKPYISEQSGGDKDHGSIAGKLWDISLQLTKHKPEQWL